MVISDFTIYVVMSRRMSWRARFSGWSIRSRAYLRRDIVCGLFFKGGEGRFSVGVGNVGGYEGIGF